jgi:dTDP-4-amino-4,6-dideoxygalactose transaminase
MKVPFIDLKACFDPLRAEMMSAMEGVFERCDFVLGKPVSELESAVREHSGAKFALGVANGTDSLVIALRALGIGPGDEVITSPFTFIATAEAINEVGALVVFQDIAPSSYNLDPIKAEQYIEANCRKTDAGLMDSRTGKRLRAILPVHLYGLMADMAAFMKMKEKYGIDIVEDAAQAQGATMSLNGKTVQAGAIGDAGCLSFYPSKNLGGAGDGGMILTNRQDVYDNANLLHVHGSNQRYYHTAFGYNSRLDSFQAAALLVKLPRMNRWLEMRADNARAYCDAIKGKLSAAGIPVVFSDEIGSDGIRPDGAVVLPAEPKGFAHTYNTFEIRVPNRDAVSKTLLEKGIGNAIYYPLALHKQTVFSFLGHAPEDFPVTEAVCSDILALPQYPELPRNAIEYVAESLAVAVKQ